jgi:predicted transcriptional regulator
VKNKETDWWEMLDDEEKASIEEGLVEADHGDVMPHKDVMAKYEKWRSKQP